MELSTGGGDADTVYRVREFATVSPYSLKEVPTGSNSQTPHFCCRSFGQKWVPGFGLQPGSRVLQRRPGVGTFLVRVDTRVDY